LGSFLRLRRSNFSMILQFTQWLQATSLFTYLRGSPFTYPVILSLHMVMILFFGGMILMTDMRLLDLGMRGYSISSVVDRLRLPKRYALMAMFLVGFLLFGCKAEEYYYNIFFRTKVILLFLIGLHYLIFRKSVYSNPGELERTRFVPVRAKLAASLSLLLWTLVICAGRSIGYTPISRTPVPVANRDVDHAARQGARYLGSLSRSLTGRGFPTRPALRTAEVLSLPPWPELISAGSVPEDSNARWRLRQYLTF